VNLTSFFGVEMLNVKLFDGKVEIIGTRQQVAKAKDVLLSNISSLVGLKEPKARIKIQDLIDEYDLKADILYCGNTIWSRKRIIRNHKRIIKAGTLYDPKRPSYVPIGSMLRMPVVGKTILSKYFYEFLHLECGSIAHYNIQGWVTRYPTLEDLKQFFRKNEYGRRVLDSIPWWETDVRRIVQDIEDLLFPLQSYMRYRKKTGITSHT